MPPHDQFVEQTCWGSGLRFDTVQIGQRRGVKPRIGFGQSKPVERLRRRMELRCLLSTPRKKPPFRHVNGELSGPRAGETSTACGQVAVNSLVEQYRFSAFLIEDKDHLTAV